MQRFAVDCAAAGLPGADPDELVELRRYLATRVARRHRAETGALTHQRSDAHHLPRVSHRGTGERLVCARVE
ncbi:hypothetical protein [Nocardia africana]|uniref:Uncharacterized protein n=1 Tax=Nocardia africana TaxID=134964 RepID=A0ABW6NQ84_9NOCA